VARRKTAEAIALQVRIVLSAGTSVRNKDFAVRLGIDPRRSANGAPAFLRRA